MEQKQKNSSYEKYCYHKGLGKWYSWDTPIGLTLGFAITLLSIGFFIVLLHLAGLF